MKNWLVATYKTKEIKRLERNLLNQKFQYYLPKITRKKSINFKPKEELMFPGYIFVNISLQNYSALKYTMGIKNIIKFGKNISHISSQDIKSMQMIEEASKQDPIIIKIQVGEEIEIKEGYLKGSMVKICSFASKKRVEVLVNFLGSLRRATIQESDLVS